MLSIYKVELTAFILSYYLFVSQTVYPRASKVVRIPPDGNEEASGSDCNNSDPENVSRAVTYLVD